MHPYQVAPSHPTPLSNRTSPLLADSPPVLIPAIPSDINKPLAPTPGSVNAPAISINKTWVLPPKPKPGRKPAVDTPPTKRKAQNREAQRAFRERRAAKVGDLEEEMKRMEDEDTREQETLRERIRHLESNVEDYRKMLEAWRERFNEMQMACGKERQLREQAEKEAEKLKDVLRSGRDAVVLPLRKDRNSQYVSQLAEEVPEVDRIGGEDEVEEQISTTCGKCSIDTRCQCIEEAFDMGNMIDDAAAPAFKRPHSPQSTRDNKRVRQDPDDIDNTEIDFTFQFATRKPSATTTASSTIPAIAPPDPCGFCSDDTPCICAEMAKECARPHQDAISMPSASPPLIRELANASSTSNPCANGSGTCAQCILNPTSALFCRSVAATGAFSTNGASAPPPPAGPALTCADAFTTLSQHPAFPAATNDLNAWISQLNAVPKVSAVPDRTAFDIEAASVMAVLKLFDRRFGSQGENVRDDGS